MRHNVEAERDARRRTSVSGAGVLLDYKARRGALAETQRSNRAREFQNKAETSMRYALGHQRNLIEVARHNLDIRRLEDERRWRSSELAMRRRLKELELANARAIAESQIRQRERIEARNIAQRQRELGVRESDIRYRSLDNAARRSLDREIANIEAESRRYAVTRQTSSAELVGRERNKSGLTTALVGLAGTLSHAVLTKLI